MKNNANTFEFSNFFTLSSYYQYGKIRTKKNAEESDTKLPWTEEMNLVLLKLVLHHGAHLPHITYDKKNPIPMNGKPVYLSKPAERFRAVTEAFYKDENGGKPFKEKFFKLQKD